MLKLFCLVKTTAPCGVNTARLIVTMYGLIRIRVHIGLWRYMVSTSLLGSMTSHCVETIYRHKPTRTRTMTRAFIVTISFGRAYIITTENRHETDCDDVWCPWGEWCYVKIADIYWGDAFLPYCALNRIGSSASIPHHPSGDTRSPPCAARHRKAHHICCHFFFHLEISFLVQNR